MPQTRPHLVTLALLVGTFLSALDVNVVGTSLPTIVGRLGGLSLYGWVFSAYLLASTTTVPLYGRLADSYGARFAPSAWLQKRAAEGKSFYPPVKGG